MRVPWMQYQLYKIRDINNRLIEVRTWMVDYDAPMERESLEAVELHNKNFSFGDFSSPSAELAISILADFMEIPKDEARRITSVPMKLHRDFLERFIAPVHPNSDTLIIDGRTVESFLEAHGVNPKTPLTDPSQVPSGLSVRDEARFWATHFTTKEFLDKTEKNMTDEDREFLERELPRREES